MKFAQHLLLVCLAGVVIGCGQKGPLMMPDAQKHKRTIPTAPGAAKPAGGANQTPQGTGPATGPASPAPPPSTPQPADSTHP